MMATSAKRVHRTRPVAPSATTKAEASVTPTPVKASFIARAKAVVVKTAKRVTVFVKAGAKRVVAVVRAGAKRVQPVAKRAWTVALRPFLRGVAAGFALACVIIGAITAPLTTVLVLLGAAGLVFASARVVQWAEDNAVRSRLARVALFVTEVLGQSLRVVVYANAALIAVLLCATSLPFAVFTALALGLNYADVRGANTIAFLAWCVLSGAWALGLLWILWRGTRDFARKEDVTASSDTRRPVVTGDEEHAKKFEQALAAARARVAQGRPVAKGAEEVADLVEYEGPAEPDETASWAETWENETACAACGTTKGAMRVRSNDVPFVTAGSGAGKPGKASTDMLCSACYDTECEDLALSMTGVSLKKRSVLVSLNAMGRAALPEFKLSKERPTEVFWAVTARWRDRRGNMHPNPRQWHCFVGGEEVATVFYDYDRRVYRATVFNRLVGTKSTEAQAKRLATDEYDRQRRAREDAATEHMVEVLTEVAGAMKPA